MLAYMLGRRPAEFGLIPDAEGFVRIKDLLKALHEEEGWRYVNLSHLNEVLLTVRTPTIEMAKNRIRAENREALAAEAAPARLPKLLFVCIRRKAHPHVKATGIQPTSHARVVLSSDRSLAQRLGKRIDPDPVILVVNVQSAQEKGVVFFQQGESLFLADSIPPECISGPPLPKDEPDAIRKPQRAASGLQHPASAGSFQMDFERAQSPHVPQSLKRRAEKRRRAERKHSESGKWSREKPPRRK
jgi:putative RNA 2'-phosphotransferase